MYNGENIVMDKCMHFSVRVIKLRSYLVEEKREYDLSKQLLRSGTSIGANLTEAQAAVSKKDFIAKAGISLKEGRESLYWIELLFRSELINAVQYDSLKNDIEEILKLLTAIGDFYKFHVKEISLLKMTIIKLFNAFGLPSASCRLSLG